METIVAIIESFYQKSEQFAKTNLEIAKLKTVDKTSDIISTLAVSFVVILLVVLFSLFLNIGIALLIGIYLDNYAYGFLIVSGFYLIVTLFVYFNRNNLIKIPVDNLVIKKLLKSDSRDDESNTN